MRTARLIGYLVATGAALVWGVPLSRGRVRRDSDLLVVTGLPRWAFGRGGTTIGGVYLTRDHDGPAVLRHEAVHRQQWLRHGLTLPIRYALAGRDPRRNRFEVEAGLEDGGYGAKTRPTSPRRTGPIAHGSAGCQDPVGRCPDAVRSMDRSEREGSPCPWTHRGRPLRRSGRRRACPPPPRD